MFFIFNGLKHSQSVLFATPFLYPLADKFFDIRLQIVCLLVYPLEWQPTQTPVTLQGTLAYVQHNTQVLIVQQQFAVEFMPFLFRRFGYAVFQPVEPLHNAVHPRFEIFFFDKHDALILKMTYNEITRV